MPRLLLIAERFPPDIGGLATSGARIADSLFKLGIELDVLVWSRYLQPGEVQPLTNTFPFSVYRIGLYRHWDMTMTHTLNFLDWLHQQKPYDAVWGHYLFPAGFLAVWFAQIKGIKSIVSARGNDVDRGIFPPGDFARTQWTLERADLITAVSKDLAKKIIILSRRDDILVIKNVVNPDIFTSKAALETKLSLRESLGISPDEIVLGFAGELREKKGQGFLLKALTKVRQNRSACLLVIGEVRTTQEAAIQLYAGQYPEDYKRLIVTGHLDEPEKVALHLQLCDIFLQPSVWEGMPNALLEAMACGCCCIASDAGGIPEIVEHGLNGFMLPRQQLQCLPDAVLECLDLDSKVRAQIGIAARDRILAEFSPLQEKLLLQSVIDRLIPSS